MSDSRACSSVVERGPYKTVVEGSIPSTPTIYMKNSKLLLYSLFHSLGVLAYILAISWFLSNGEKIFNESGKPDSFLAPAFMLILLVISATITGALVLGKPILLYIENKKIEAIKMLSYTVGWLAMIAMIILFGLTVLR